MMNRIKYMILAVATLSAFSCMKDGETLIATLDQEKGSEIMTPDGDLVLSLDKASALALTLYWDETGNIVLNNPDAQVGDDMVINAVQFSADKDFSEVQEISISSGQYSLQLTCAQLNSILSRLGYEPDVPSPLYIRIRTALGENTGSIYGDTLELTVTSYFVDWSSVRIIPKGDSENPVAALPAAADGEYAGFVNVPNSWYNFYFMEGDNTIYGCLNDGDAATVFALETTTDINNWNCWFPEGQSDTDPASYACWYVTMSRSDMEWSAMRIRSMWLQYGEGDDDNAEFEYNSGRTAWRAVFTTAQDNVQIGLDEWGTLYNRQTGEANPEETEFSLLAGQDGTLTVGAAGEASGLTTGEAGTYTLILYLADMKWELLEGDQDIAMEWPADEGYAIPATEAVFIYDLVEGVPSEAAATLRKTVDGMYCGFVNLVEDYSFKIGDAENPSSATHLYGSAPVDNSEEANYRLHSGDDMYPIAHLGSTGYSYVTVDFNNRSWSSIAVTGVTLDFSEGEDIGMTFNGSTRTWTAETELDSWNGGIRFLVNGETLCYTDSESDGTLAAGEGYFTPSMTTENGHRYRITLNLTDMTYIVEDITEEEGPVYPDRLYVIYSWDSGWPLDITHDAAILAPGETSGTYTGYFMSGDAWGTMTNYIFCDYSRSSINVGEIGAETRYGNNEDGILLVKSAADKNDGIGACWLSSLGLHLFKVDLATMTFTREWLDSNIHAVTDGNETTMTFNTTTLMWEATMELSAGNSLTFRIDQNGNHVYGGSDGILATATDSNAIYVTESGQYLVTVDLRDYSSLKYNLQKQD